MAISPMMQHYLQTKEKYKDCVLFYRLGDFYEMFFDDAKKVSSMLELTLTGKDCGLPERAPMCGIPFHAAEGYIAKLVSMGEKVAICEQLSEPGGKNLVERDVIKIVTAGTVTESELIDDKKNNFIGSIYIGNKEASFSWADITTGEFFTESFSDKNYLDALFDTLVKISPVELIGNKNAFELFKDSPFVIRGVLPKIENFLDSEFNYNISLNSLCTQFGVSSLTPYSLKDGDICICSSGALISYLRQTQKHSLLNITNIKKLNADDGLMLDINAVRNLELVKTLRDGKSYGSLLWLLDKTKTSMGARKLSSWILSPLYNAEKINYRLDGVSALYDNTLVRSGLSDILGGVRDIGRIAGKIANGNLNPKDCLALKTSLSLLPSIKFALSGITSKIICDILDNLYDFFAIVNLLENAINPDCSSVTKDGGYIKEGYNAELDELVSYKKNGQGKLNELEERERIKTGIKTLKICFNKVFGYSIEITNSFKEMVPYDYIRRQTLTNAERYVTVELKELEDKILSSEEKSLQLELKIFNEIKGVLAKEIDKFKTTADSLAELDVLNSLAIVARENGYVRPIIVDSNEKLDIVDGRHPVVEAISKQKFVPNDCLLDSGENRTMILTGPNMAGKSTFMRQIALIVLMAHIGSFVPARSAQIPLTDKIFTRVGASDNLILDQSTFMVEMTEVSEILNNATSNSLLILDEIGRGTSTYDGLSIAWAIVEYITKNIKAKTLFATHYHELTELEGVLDGVKNYKITVKEMQNTIVFLRKIMRGGANRSFGIEVASLAGISNKVTDRAKEILSGLEKKDRSQVNVNFDDDTPKVSEIERIIKDTDVNNLTPIQAFNLLLDLSEKVKKDE